MSDTRPGHLRSAYSKAPEPTRACSIQETCPLSRRLCGPDAGTLLALILYMLRSALTAGP